MSADLCTRDEYFKYHKSLVYGFKSYYIDIFKSWAENYKFIFHDIDIIIVDEWSWNTVIVSEVDNGIYHIKIARGLFERLSYIIRLMFNTEMEATILRTEIFEDVWKNPEFSFYDEFERIDFQLKDHIRPLLHNYGNNLYAYNKDFDAHWSYSWPIDEVDNLENAIPFLWVIDFLIYHEMSHILLRHLEIINQNNNRTISEFSLGNQEPFFERHLMELHADVQAIFMAIQTLDEFKKAISGCEITEFMEKNMFNYAFLIMIIFAVWGKARTSYRRYKSLPNPHPDFRKLMLLESVSNCLFEGSQHSIAWRKQYKKAFFAVQNSFFQIGALGFGNSILNPYSPAILSQYGPSKLQEWQDDFYKEYIIYKHELSKFVQYFSKYDSSIQPVSNEILCKDQIIIETRPDFGHPEKLFHYAYTGSQFAKFLYDFHRSKS